MITLKGKSAIITGANQGFGKVLTETFLKAGARVTACARDEQLLERSAADLAESLSLSSDRLYTKSCDVANREQVKSLIDFAVDRCGPVDILVNNAGVYGPKGLIEEVDWQEWTEALAINLMGPVLMCRALIPHFKTHGHGKIINLSGGGATAPLPRFSAYAASKAAIVRLTETIAHETAEYGIDVNAIAPGALNTRLLEEVIAAGPAKVGKAFYERSLKQQKEGGASMERAADLCLFLASDESNGITGRLLSAVWDPWEELPKHRSTLSESEIYTLRRIVPSDRGENWG